MYHSYNTSTTFLLYMPPLSIKLKFCFSSVKINTDSKFLYHTTHPGKKFWMTVKGILDRTGFFRIHYTKSSSRYHALSNSTIKNISVIHPQLHKVCYLALKG